MPSLTYATLKWPVERKDPANQQEGPANTMWRKLLYSGFETCFGPSTQGAGTKTHLKSRFSAILKKRGRDVKIWG